MNNKEAPDYRWRIQSDESVNYLKLSVINTRIAILYLP